MIQNFIKSGLIPPESAGELIAACRNKGTRVVFMDASYALPGAPNLPADLFFKERVDNAVFFDIETISCPNTDLPHMLPGLHDFEKSMSDLGIHNDDLIIVYAQQGIIMAAARAWWMLRVFGHDQVVVLDGGLPAWKKSGLPVTTTPPTLPTPSTYKARGYRGDLVCAMETVAAASENRLCPILDARPEGRFQGSVPEPRPNLKSGHIPGSLNIPAGQIVSPDTGRLLPKTALLELLTDKGINLKSSLPDKIIATCGSGVTACMIALALYHLGYDTVSVYDGSWSEWGQENATTTVSTGS